MRIERVEHAEDRRFIDPFEFELPGVIVLDQSNGFGKILADLFSRNGIAFALADQALSGVSARKSQWHYQGYDQQQVPLHQFHSAFSPKQKTGAKPSRRS